MNCIPVTYNQLRSVLNRNTIHSLVSRGKVRRIKRSCYKTPALYDLTSFPLKYQIEVYREHPEIAMWNSFELSADPKAIYFFSEYKIDKHRHLSYSKIDEYVNNACILNAISIEARSQKLKCNFWAEIAIRVKNTKCSLPCNPRRLQAKYQEYKEYGYIALVSKRFNNQNARKK